MQQSFPVEQPQPNQEFYGLDVLALFQTYTRDSYRAAGNGDPVWDPSRPEQDWWDDTYDGHQPGEPVTFSVVVWAGDGTATIETRTQPAKWMRTPNFKGLPIYPKWTPAPTFATRNGGPFNPQGIAQNPHDMSTPEQAEALRVELGGTSVTDAGANSLTIPGIGQLVFPVNYPVDDPRREYAVVLSTGKLFNAGQALGMKYSAGIGHPGHWVADPLTDSGLNWQSDPVPDGSTSTVKPLPPPCRALKPNEELLPFMSSAWTTGTRVHRKDLAVPSSTPNSGTNSDAGDLADIRTKVTALYNLLVPHN